MESCAERQEPASADDRALTVAYTELLAACLRALQGVANAELRETALSGLREAFAAACPREVRAHAPEELLLQACCPPHLHTESCIARAL